MTFLAFKGHIFLPTLLCCLITGFSSLTGFFVEFAENVLQMFYNVKFRLQILAMATVRQVVLPPHKKEDGTWNVKIRVTHKRKCTYIDTEHFVNAKQLRKDHKIKDHFILDLLHSVLKEYRGISGLGSKLSFYMKERIESNELLNL